MDNLTAAYLLLFLGLLLLFAELVIPTGGLLFVLAGLCALIGVVLVFRYGDPYQGLLTLAVVAVVLPLLGAGLLYLWPRTPMGRRLVRRRVTSEEPTGDALPGAEDLEQLRGRYGRTVSPLRPVGVVEFDGRRVDTLSEGTMVEPGTWVRCVDVRGNRVIVRPVDAPDLDELESADFS